MWREEVSKAQRVGEKLQLFYHRKEERDRVKEKGRVKEKERNCVCVFERDRVRERKKGLKNVVYLFLLHPPPRVTATRRSDKNTINQKIWNYVKNN